MNLNTKFNIKTQKPIDALKFIQFDDREQFTIGSYLENENLIIVEKKYYEEAKKSKDNWTKVYKIDDDYKFKFMRRLQVPYIFLFVFSSTQNNTFKILE